MNARARHRLLVTVVTGALAIGVAAAPPAAGATTLTAGEILVTEGGERTVSLVRIDPVSGARTLLASNVTAEDLVVDRTGDVLVADANGLGDGAVIRVDGRTGATSVLATGGNISNNIQGIALESTGGVLVTDSDRSGVGVVLRVDPVSGSQTVVSTGGLLSGLASGIVIGAGGAVFVNVRGTPARVVRVDPVSGAQSIVSSGGTLAFPSGLAIDAGGFLVVADSAAFGGAGGVIRVDPVSGAQTTISSGGLFDSPSRVAIEADGQILVNDTTVGLRSPSRIIRVDPEDGSQTVVATSTPRETYGGLFFPGIAVVPTGAVTQPPTLTVTAGGSCDGGSAGVAVNVTDPDTPVSALTLTAVSSNPAVLPNPETVGTAADRELVIVPGRAGRAVVTVTVSDGGSDAAATLTVVAGSPRSDRLEGTSGLDVVLGGAGNDAVTGGTGPDVLCGGPGNDVLIGGEGEDALDGQAGSDLLFGGPGADSLRGGSGPDALVGGPGADAYSGGPGKDADIGFRSDEGDTSDGS